MIRAADFMTRDLTAVMPTDLIEDAVQLLAAHRLTGVPVVEEDWRLVGFLSERDVLKLALPTFLEIVAGTTFLEEDQMLLSKLRSIGKRRVEEVMNREVVCVDVNASLLSVADLLIRGRVKRLPVVDGGKLVGVIDRGSFCEFMLEADHGKVKP